MILFRNKWAYGDPYLEAINLSFIFTWGDGETKDRVKVSMPPLFEGSSINNNKLGTIQQEQNAWQCKYDLKQDDEIMS